MSSSAESIATFVLISLMVALIIWNVVMLRRWHESVSRAMLDRWAKGLGAEILRGEKAGWFDRGPFRWTSTNQAFYRIVVRGRDGGVRSGLARCGSRWFAMLVDKVEIRWDDKMPAPSPPLPATSTKRQADPLWDRDLDS